ncbi:MAG: SDR family NAD(P)-dependent oxidoreductase [Actinobacteria bacterium]|nr:SDR family NAD(P)-dependent oxidoreductase [Actinomycetota bacterium]
MSKVALITGASAGIGAGFADLLASENYDLILVARDEERLTQSAAILTSKFGITCEVLRADLTVSADLRKVEARLLDQENPVDVLINNAGFGIKSSFTTSNIKDEQQLLDVLVTAPMRLMHAVLPVMKSRNSGIVINVSSVAGWIAGGTYSAAKSYLTVLSESIHTELSNTEVTVMALCPGFTRTEFHERGKMSMKGLPKFMWLSSEFLVKKAWSDALAGFALLNVRVRQRRK